MAYCYADEATKLIRQLKRWPDSLLPYESEIVRNASDEVVFLVDQTESAKAKIDELRRSRPAEEDEANKIKEKQLSLFVAAKMNQLSCLRNKRALLLYHNHRLEHIRSMSWELGNSISSSSSTSTDPNNGILPVNVKKHLSTPEHHFLSDYCKLLEDLRGVFMEVDLGASLVRVLKDIGEVVMESGSVVRLKKNNQLYLRRTDVENFITMGYLAQI
ncbi:hypothetical protein BC829DRAFT_401780 [Chytridium lagenaria]|nr:hypothetical protein BC829DRAFT_401780 [Chytridium lagenaria]